MPSQTDGLFKLLPAEVQELIFQRITSLEDLQHTRLLSKNLKAKVDLLLAKPLFIIHLIDSLSVSDATKFIHTYKNLFVHDQSTPEKIICFALTTDDIYQINVDKLKEAIQQLYQNQRLSDTLAKNLNTLCKILPYAQTYKNENKNRFLFMRILRGILRTNNVNHESFFNLQGINLSGGFVNFADLAPDTKEFFFKYPTDLYKLNLMGLNLAKLELAVDFNHSFLMYVNLRESSLPLCNMTNANLAHADLTDANLEHGILKQANLNKANLTRANLTDANLSGANLVDAVLDDVRISKDTVFKDAMFIAPHKFKNLEKFEDALSRLNQSIKNNRNYVFLNLAIVADIKKNVENMTDLVLASKLLSSANSILFPAQKSDSSPSFFKYLLDLQENKKIVDDCQQEITAKMAETARSLPSILD